MGVVCQSPTLCYKLFLYKLCDRYKAYFLTNYRWAHISRSLAITLASGLALPACSTEKDEAGLAPEELRYYQNTISF